VVTREKVNLESWWARAPCPPCRASGYLGRLHICKIMRPCQAATNGDPESLCRLAAAVTPARDGGFIASDFSGKIARTPHRNEAGDRPRMIVDHCLRTRTIGIRTESATR